MRNITYKNTHKLLYMAVQIAINDLSSFRNTNINKK